MFRTLFS